MIDTRTKEELDEIGRLGLETYRRLVRPHLRKEDEFKHVIFDIDTGDYELDRDEIAAYDRLRLRRPTGRLFDILAGYTVAGSFCGLSDAFRDPL